MRDMAGPRWPGKTKAILVPVVLLVVFALHSSAQTSAKAARRGGLVAERRGRNSAAHPNLREPECVGHGSDQINAALAACPSGQTVYLAAGTYAITGTVRIPSNVTLRGAGADRTILNATGGSGDVVSMGSGSVAYRPVRITERRNRRVHEPSKSSDASGHSRGKLPGDRREQRSGLCFIRRQRRKLQLVRRLDE